MENTAFTNCVQCHNEFDENKRYPHVLSCLHTCCSSCLERIVSGKQIFCPECHSQTEISNDPIKDLPLDTACRNYLDFVRIQRKPSEILCTDCPDQSSASAFCKECYNFMCPECTSAHKRTAITRKHTVVSIGDLKDSGLREFHRKDTCNKPGHEEQVFTFYCDRRGCDVPICTLCAVCDHNQTNGHLIRNLSDVYEDSKTVVQSVIREINARGTPMSEAVDQLERVVDELASTETQMSQEIDTIFDKYQKILNERRYQLQMEVQNHCQVKKRDLQEKVKTLKSYTTDVKTATDFTNRVLLYTTATEFLNLKNIILRRILELKNVNVSIPAKDDVALRFLRGVSDDSFVQLINGIGNVSSRESPVPQSPLHNGHTESSMKAGRSEYVSSLNQENARSPSRTSPSEASRNTTFATPPTPQQPALRSSDSIPMRQLSVQATPTLTREPVQRQSSLPVPMEEKRNISTIAMMNGLPKNPAEEKSSFFNRAKPSDDHVTADVTEKKPRPAPLKLDSPQPLGLGDFLRNLEMRGELPMKKSERTVQATRDSFQQLSPDRPFQPVTSPISPKTPTSVPPELKNLPGVIYGDVVCPEFTFDVLTIHNEREVSLDGKVLRNRKTGKPSSCGTAEKQLQNYKGIIGNFAFKDPGKYYYEVDVSFTIYQPLEQTWLVYELGICRKDIIDTHHTVERHEHARSCYVARYPEDGKLAHEFWHNRDLLTYVPLSDNAAGITVELTYGLLIDTKRRKWTVADVGKQKKLHTFTGIDFTEALLPVFGTYNPDLVSVEMTLRTGSEISAFPPFLKGF
ncbi:E3 ubiquitin-protein ligase TRIM33-like isoform X1 [Saccostrea echinata]|uniref:E3 ubiquitin-protein ligase TRIM33-like isoform X1 n=1 Tax=Saccostrea echinata TaxID=191078 RepID=UPI002A7ED9EA|nr:E3 ubiquitin-protein ligase TRIM33-like isoform X1 [Saccostrea echinata]XP_061194589.1 E3 ubiquitin-protein ligase TRIM33-like isoform X1 [Saccostrea echinata]